MGQVGCGGGRAWSRWAAPERAISSVPPVGSAPLHRPPSGAVSFSGKRLGQTRRLPGGRGNLAGRGGGGGPGVALPCPCARSAGGSAADLRCGPPVPPPAGRCGRRPPRRNDPDFREGAAGRPGAQGPAPRHDLTRSRHGVLLRQRRPPDTARFRMISPWHNRAGSRRSGRVACATGDCGRRPNARRTAV